MVPHCGFDLTFPNANDVNNLLFICLLVICLPSLEKYLLKFFAHFFIFLLFSFISSLYNVDIKPLSNICFIMLSEVSQTMIHQHQMRSVTCGMWKKDTMNFLAEQILTHRLWKNLWFSKDTVWGVGGCAGGMGWKYYKTGFWWSLYNYK